MSRRHEKNVHENNTVDSTKNVSQDKNVNRGHICDRNCVKKRRRAINTRLLLMMSTAASGLTFGGRCTADFGQQLMIKRHRLPVSMMDRLGA